MLKRIFFRILLFSFLFNSANLSGAEPSPARGRNGMVSSASDLASMVGLKILEKGGNAIDAAVAVQFALAVTFPEAGNIGGGGFMVIHLAKGKNTTIDFRETAPSCARRDVYLDDKGNVINGMSTTGWTSSGVPGSVAGMLYALDKYGSMTLDEVISPAIELAENGFPLSYDLARDINYSYNEFVKYPSSKKIFTNAGEHFIEGDYFIQTDLAKTLREILLKGKAGFYDGWVADSIVAQSTREGWNITKEDLLNYVPVERKPVYGEYKGFRIVSMAPPSSGGIALVETLNILKNFDLNLLGWHSADYIYTIVEALKYVYADRSKHLGDPDFYNVPATDLLSQKYADGIAEKIKERNGLAKPSDEIFPADFTEKESTETTHYVVADKYGNAVSCTTTINSAFGNKIVVNGAGFLMNNEMDDFSAKPGVPNQYGLIGSEANSIAPHKRMLSSMTPTILLKDGKFYLAAGSPGGSTIITTVLQIILNAVDFNMNISEAIGMPRFHHQWKPDRIDYEKYAILKEQREILSRKGENIGKVRSLGRAEGIIYNAEKNIFYGATDPRGYGLAIGY